MGPLRVGNSCGMRAGRFVAGILRGGPRRNASPQPPVFSAPEPIMIAGIPVDFILFAPDAARRRPVPPPHAAGGA